MSPHSGRGPLSVDEKELLLTALRRVADPEGQPPLRILELSSRIDWRRVMFAAARDRALGITGHVLETSGLLKVVPKDVRLAFHGAMLASEAEVAKRKAQRDAVLAMLAARKVRVILLKGSSLEGTVYRGAPYREMSDVDLLVRPEQRDAALAALAENGFTVDPERNRWQADYFALSLGRRGLSHPSLGGVDVHWDPSYWTGARRVRIDLDGFWSRSMPAASGLANVRRLSPEDDFALLLLHALEFRGIHFYHLVDLSLLLSHCEMTEEKLDHHLGPNFPAAERPRLRGVFRSLRELVDGAAPLSALSREARRLSERFLPDHADAGLSIREVMSHADGPLALARYFIGHALPVPAAYPGLGTAGRYRAHVGHYWRQIRRLA